MPKGSIALPVFTGRGTVGACLESIHGPRPLAIWGAGRRARGRARHLMERGIVPTAWIDLDPRKIGRQLGGIPVEDAAWLRDHPGWPFVLIYIARHGACREVSSCLDRMGYLGGDYIAVG